MVPARFRSWESTVISADEEAGNYILTVFFGASIPTGTYANGAKSRPEVEVNSTFWKQGEQDSKKQTFVTPGIIFGRCRLHSLLVMALGGGYRHHALPHLQSRGGVHRAFPVLT